MAPISKKKKWQILSFKTLPFFLLKTGNANPYFSKYPRNSKNPLYYRTRTHVQYLVCLLALFAIWITHCKNKAFLSSEASTDGPLISGWCLLHSAHPKVRCLTKVGSF